MRPLLPLLLAAVAASGAQGCGDRREPAAVAEAAAARPRRLSQKDYDSWRQPDRIVAAFALAPGQRVADVGAGDGYFTLRLAEAVGPTGSVTATDIDPRALAELSRLAQYAAALQARFPAAASPSAASPAAAPPAAAPSVAAPIDVRRVEPHDPGLELGRYDRILLAQVDHLLADRVDYLRRLRAALAPGGRLAVSNRIQHRAGLLRAADAAGYAIAADITSLPGQFLVLLVPQPEREVMP